LKKRDKKIINNIPNGQVPLDLVEKNVFYNDKIRKTFNSITKGAVVTIKRSLNTRKKTLERTGECIYKDNKIFVIKLKQHREAYSINDFMNYWKVERIEAPINNLYV